MPTVDVSWQGNPPQRMSTGSTVVQAIAVMSPRLRASGQLVGEDVGDALLDLAEPDGAGVEDLLDGKIKSAVVGEQRSDPQAVVVVGRLAHEHSG